MNASVFPAEPTVAPPAKRVMRRRAADNPYFHRDFHGVLSAGLAYVESTFGDEAVPAFVRRFAHGYHAPLRQAMIAEGLAALRRYLERVFTTEGAAFTIAETPDSLTLDLAADPVLRFLRENHYAIARSFPTLDEHLYAALCEETPWAFERTGYDPQTGACRLRFFRRIAP